MSVGIGFVLASLAGLILMRKYTPPHTLICGTLCTSVGIFAILLGTKTGMSATLPFAVLSLLLLGLGNGTVIPIATGVVLRYLPKEIAGMGGAILTTGQQLAGAVGTVLAGALLLTDGNPPVSAAAYVNGLAVQVSAAFAALLCAALLSRIPAPTQ